MFYRLKELRELKKFHSLEIFLFKRIFTHIPPVIRYIKDTETEYILNYTMKDIC